MRILSTCQAANELGISPRRVNALIADGRLPAQKIGTVHLINAADLDKVRDRPTGRPPMKTKPARPKSKPRKN